MLDAPFTLRDPDSRSLTARLTAWTFAGRLDEQLALGFTGKPGTPLAAHARRLESRRERQRIAGSLQRVAADAHDASAWRTGRIPLHRSNIRLAGDAVELIVDRLRSPRPVQAKGMARIRRVLSDGGGPLYQFGDGDLDGRLRAALCAL
ncbi:hypothetical protein C6A87_006635 [Mycobacterium sp. ITM-2016-00317]|uniref:hypothetical protein n=1 Tax=Mycobacterium sp. ITM-2016-00317 TaxID=2099694 RepID=UPI000D4E0FC0|nr:hypothetical protein [Mycobacterium sp. ITM-2016-00317]WNG88883.1 hypothetical protein C6A87_006635 [Mycobacterium sp. ITM-2016-00317]